jgi:hypothetical protein
MKFVSRAFGLFLLCTVPSFAGDIYDTSGNRIFHTEKTGEIHQTVTADGVKNSYEEIRLVHDPSGRSYVYDRKWDQVISDGAVVMDYKFNRRTWYWVGGQGIEPCRDKGGVFVNCTGAADTAERTYVVEDKIYRTSEQGEYPILTYEDGTYTNEFGEPVYTLKNGGFPGWSAMMLLHYHYEQHYKSENFGEIENRRIAEAGMALESNAIAQDMLSMGRDYEKQPATFSGTPYEMVYFTMVNGAVELLDEEQVSRLLNKWLVLNEKTRRRSRPFDIPEGGFYTSRKDAKKLGLQDMKAHHLILEIKARPEFAEEFRAAITQG